MTFSEPSDLPDANSPDSVQEFESELEENATQASKARPDTRAAPRFKIGWSAD